MSDPEKIGPKILPLEETWMGGLVIAGELADELTDKTEELARAAASAAPEVPGTVTVYPDGAEDAVIVAFQIQGRRNRHDAMELMSRVTLEALAATGTRPEEVSLLEGRLVNGEQLDIDRDLVDANLEIGSLRFVLSDTDERVFKGAQEDFSNRRAA